MAVFLCAELKSLSVGFITSEGAPYLCYALYLLPLTKNCKGLVISWPAVTKLPSLRSHLCNWHSSKTEIIQLELWMGRGALKDGVYDEARDQNKGEVPLLCFGADVQTVALETSPGLCLLF